MDIFTPHKKTTEEEVKELEKRAVDVAAEADQILKKAELKEQIHKDEIRIKEAKTRISATGGGRFFGLKIGGTNSMSSKQIKIIIIVVGTLVLFALMKVMGC